MSRVLRRSRTTAVQYNNATVQQHNKPTVVKKAEEQICNSTTLVRAEWSTTRPEGTTYFGYSASHVSSPMNTSRLPAATACAMTLSSWIAAPSKFDPMSMKVGSDPVVRPLSRWEVTVGGSPRNPNNALCDAFSRNILCMRWNRLYGVVDGQLSSVEVVVVELFVVVSTIKSNRNASTMNRKARWYVRGCDCVPRVGASPRRQAGLSKRLRRAVAWNRTSSAISRPGNRDNS